MILVLLIVKVEDFNLVLFDLLSIFHLFEKRFIKTYRDLNVGHSIL